ncbi:hypothetical protein T06_13941 [Trichinella sp. T6]|nr:hypothetical protein T06_13941 [Trichinella sp. T6]
MVRMNGAPDGATPVKTILTAVISTPPGTRDNSPVPTVEENITIKGKLAGKATNFGQSDPAHALVPDGTTTPSAPQPEAQVEGNERTGLVTTTRLLLVVRSQ